MRIIVYGGRKFDRRYTAFAVLSALDVHLLLNFDKCINCVIHGDAPGADHLGRDWAIENLVAVQKFPAAWGDLSPPCKIKHRANGTAYNALAGFKRNQRMITFGQPDGALEFPGGSGTLDMRARLLTYKKDVRPKLVHWIVDYAGNLCTS